MMKRSIKKDNIIVNKYDLIIFVETIPEDAHVLGETNTFLIERNCILVNEDSILKDGLLRFEYYQYVCGIKIGYLEVGYNEYVILKSVSKIWVIFIYIILFILIVFNIILYCCR